MDEGDATIFQNHEVFGEGSLVGGDIAKMDWAGHPLGMPTGWPPQLLSMLATACASPQPMFLAWGPDLFFFFNDAYRPLLGERAENAIGRRFRDVWADEWAELEPIVMRALSGEGARFEEWPLRVTRNGYPEDTWWTFSYMPLRDAHGAIVGMWCITSDATGQVTGRRAAAFERERQQRLVEQMPGFVAVLAGPRHVFQYVNEAYRVLAGQRELIGRAVRDVFPDLSGQDIYETLDKVYRTGERHIARGLPIRLNGDAEQRYIDLLYEAIRDTSGKISGIFVGGYDVTEAYHTVAALAESEERLSLVIEGARDHAILTTNLEGMITSWSAGAEAVFGWRSDEMIGESTARVFTPEDRESGAHVAELRTAGELGCANDERWHLRRDGSLVFLNGSVHPLRKDAEGEIQGFLKIARDETERRRTIEELRLLNETLEMRVEERTQALRDSRDFARLALSAVGGVGVWTYEFETDCFYCDANIASLYDVDAEEGAAGIRRERFLANVHEDDLTALRTTMAGGAANKGDLELEYRLVHRDGSVHWVLSRGHTYFEDDRPVRRTGVGVEMTKQREIEEQLRQAQKMEAVGQLTGGIAHDFNNLLQGITGSLEIINRRVEQGRFGDLERLVTGATTAANRAAALTHRLLAFSRRQPLDPRPVKANSLVASMEDLIQRSLGENIQLDLALHGGLWTTRCDPNQLESAILNLVINARDAMPDGGKLTIATTNLPITTTLAATRRGLQPGDFVCVSVSDTGIGMSRDTIAKAFEPFFTTKPIGQGTGLGLSMIYGFAKQSEGYVEIDSKVGSGTTFRILLPRHRGDALADDESSTSTEDYLADRAEVVLVVEDEAVVRSLVVEELAELGYVAIEAPDGAKGLEVLRSTRQIDLLITDIGLPGMNGKQVADAARELRRDLKVLFMTGYAENATLSSGFLEPGMELITKPFTMGMLAARVRAILESKKA